MSAKHVNTKPYLIGLTGGIGSGKTTAANYIEKLGLKVIDSDLIVKHLYQSNLKMKKQIECLVSFQIETKEDKRKLADMIFENQELRNKINSIIHPLVYEAIDKTIKENQNQEIIFIDMPLLFEVGYEKHVDQTLLIYLPKSIQIKRIKERNPLLTYKEIEKRIQSQMPLYKKRKLANVVIDNRFDLETLNKNIDLFIRGIKHEKQQSI